MVLYKPVPSFNFKQLLAMESSVFIYKFFYICYILAFCYSIYCCYNLDFICRDKALNNNKIIEKNIIIIRNGSNGILNNLNSPSIRSYEFTVLSLNTINNSICNKLLPPTAFPFDIFLTRALFL